MRPALPSLLLLLGLTVLAYLPALQAGFIWDDDSYVTENRALEADDGLVRIWTEPTASPQYYPLVFSTFWLERRLWGERAWGYHLTNVLLHAAGAGLLLLLLRRLSVPGALLAAAIFAVHPVHVESVAWISRRKNVLSGLFYLLALGSCLRFTGVDEDDGPRAGGWPWLLLGFALFGAALLSKTVTCTLPAAVLVILWWRRGRVTAVELLGLLPFFVVGIAMGLLTANLESKHVGAELLELDLTILERVYLAGRIAWFYALKLLVPVGLVFIYPRWVVDQAAWWQALFPLAAVALLVVLWTLRARIGRGPLAAALLFGGTLVPALGFIDVFPMRYSWVADHFAYHASLAPITLVAAILATVVARRLPPRTGPVLAAALVAMLAVLTWRQARMYEDLETLWRVTLARNPDASIAHINLGNILAARDEHEAAIEHFRAVVEAVQPPEQDRIVLARAWLNMGNGLYTLDRPEAALEAYQSACATYPRYAKAHLGRGLSHLRLRDWDESVTALRRVLELLPDPAHPLHERARSALETVERRAKFEAEGGSFRQTITPADLVPGKEPP